MKSLLIFIMLNPFILIGQPWLMFYSFPYEYHNSDGIITDYDQGYLLNIIVADFYPLYNAHTLLQKINDNGELLYEIQMGNEYTENTRFFSISTDLNRSIILAGANMGTDYNEDPIIVKLDSCREKEWCTRLANNLFEPDFFIDATIIDDGSIVALSIQNDPENMNSFHLHKFNSEGQPVWRKELASPNIHPDIWDPDAYNLLALDDGGFLITGTCYWPNPEGGSAKYIRMFLVKAGADGTEEWLYVHGVDDYIYSMAVTSVIHNNIIFTGGAWYNPQNTYPTPQLFVNDLGGNHVFDQPVIIPDTNGRRSEGYLLLTNNMNSCFWGSAKMYVPGSYSNTRPVMIKIDTIGNVLDKFITETQPPQYWAGLPSLTHDGKIIVAGACAGTNPDYDDIYAMRLLPELELDSIPWSNLNYDTLCPEPIVSHVISLDDCLIVVNNEDYSPPVKQTELKITPAPVPANATLRLIYDNTLRYRNITVKCYNSIGKEVTSFCVNSGVNETTLDVVNWSPGLYMAVAFSGSQAVGRCKFIVE